MTLTDKVADNIVTYLTKYLNQGGHLYPVTSTLSGLEYGDGRAHEWDTFADTHRNDNSVNIIMHKDGFKIQESVRVTNLTIVDSDLQKKFGTLEFNAHQLVAVEGECFIEAAATINLDFSGSGHEPVITVENNMITYHNSEIARLMDKRSLGQMIVDFFRYVLGLNQVKDISPAVAIPIDIQKAAVDRNHEAVTDSLLSDTTSHNPS